MDTTGSTSLNALPCALVDNIIPLNLKIHAEGDYYSAGEVLKAIEKENTGFEFVYILGFVDDLVKVGRTINLYSRMQSYISALRKERDHIKEKEFVILYLIRTSDSKTLERILHTTLFKHRADTRAASDYFKIDIPTIEHVLKTELSLAAPSNDLPEAPAFTYIPTTEYQDLTERARLNDLIIDRINAQDKIISGISERLAKAEFELSGKDGSITAHYENWIGKLEQRLAKLEHPTKNPGQTTQDRATRIDHYMDARPDHKASYEALKGFLGINDVLLNAAIAALKKEHPGKYGTAKDTNDKRKRILAVIPKIT